MCNPHCASPPRWAPHAGSPTKPISPWRVGGWQPPQASLTHLELAPAPITSKGSPSTSGKMLDTSSWPQRPPWKAFPTMVTLEKRGLMWKAMSPVSDKKLISNLGGIMRATGSRVVTLPKAEDGTPAGVLPLPVLPSIRVCPDQQAPAWGQAPGTEGFKLREQRQAGVLACPGGPGPSP